MFPVLTGVLFSGLRKLLAFDYTFFLFSSLFQWFNILKTSHFVAHVAVEIEFIHRSRFFSIRWVLLFLPDVLLPPEANNVLLQLDEHYPKCIFTYGNGIAEVHLQLLSL